MVALYAGSKAPVGVYLSQTSLPRQQSFRLPSTLLCSAQVTRLLDGDPGLVNSLKFARMTPLIGASVAGHLAVRLRLACLDHSTHTLTRGTTAARLAPCST
jgi:hypothetical protein